MSSLAEPPLDRALRVAIRTAMRSEILIAAAERSKLLGQAPVAVNAGSGN
jgi:hypothetical protein